MDFAGIEVKNNIFLAPMAGVCDRAYREICMDMGAGLCVSEMVSAKAICYNDKKTAGLLSFGEAERPFLIQLFGSEPETVAKAIDIIETKLNIHPDGYDLNMGCPAPKIVSNGEGSALMRNPALAARIVRAARTATSLPVSVKHRSGWDREHVNAVDFALYMQEAGASFVTLHARTRDQFYALRADLTLLKAVKDALSVPVAGSGDIFSAADAANMLKVTGCDAVMAARGAQGNPWLFRETLSYLESGTLPPRPDIGERMDMMMRHARLMCTYKEERGAMREFRKHINWYIKGIKNATTYKNRANTVSTLTELSALAEDIKRAYLDPDTLA
ncbi:MAG: tRNA dihydrouridine synthase DusB [Clostridia bacterium]|nr:tRNA dihydrouridine synthase DusB [Clostridia bacterium]